MKNTSVFLGSAAMILALTMSPAVAAAQGRGADPQTPATTATPATPARTTTTPPPPPMSAATHLANQPALAAKLQPLLPAGTNLQTAATGFKNLGAFVSAVHVSKNLDIPFADLKAKLTGANAVSLGKAIQELKPTADADQEVKKATDQAKQDQNGKGL
jgi:hypothetical protein